MVWEADCFWGTVPIGQSDERLRYPFCYVISDKASYYVLHTRLSEENDHGANFLNEICEAVKKNGIFPETILIRHPHLMSVFAPLVAFGISTRVVDRLPCIEDVRQEMFKAFKLGGVMNPAQGVPAKQLKMTELIKAPVKKQPKQLINVTVYQFKVTLDNVMAPIWREFEVESNITLKRFAVIILKVMGWTNTHLHQLEIAGRQFSLPCEGGDNDFENENKFFLHDFSLKELRHMLLMYDFGDGWEHSITLEDVMEPKKGVKYPRCIQGERNCPPEDCGGPMGYLDFYGRNYVPSSPRT